MIPIPADRMNIMRSILLVCLFCICIGCIDDSGKSNTGNGTSDDNGPVENVSDSHDGDGDGEIVIFLTGETLGQLKPCGCTAGQLGGFEKRKTVLDAVDSKRRLLLDTGHLIEGQSEQNILKYNIIIQALSMLGYDAVNFNSKDVEVARDHIGLDSIPFAIISGSDDTGQLKSTYSRKFKVNGKVLQVTVASVISEQISGDKLSKLFLSEPGIIGLNILLVDSCEKETLDAIDRKSVV